jgi:hypothetical protein
LLWVLVTWVPSGWYTYRSKSSYSLSHRIENSMAPSWVRYHPGPSSTITDRASQTVPLTAGWQAFGNHGPAVWNDAPVHS